jgi:hypothetical protein
VSGVPPVGLYSLRSPSPLRRAQRGEESRPPVTIPHAEKGRRLYARTDRIGFCFEVRARENDENHTEYRWQSFDSGRRHLVPSGDQCASWEFHDGTDSVGGLWRHRCCGGHRLIAESQPQRQTIRGIRRIPRVRRQNGYLIRTESSPRPQSHSSSPVTASWLNSKRVAASSRFSHLSRRPAPVTCSQQEMRICVFLLWAAAPPGSPQESEDNRLCRSSSPETLSVGASVIRFPECNM